MIKRISTLLGFGHDEATEKQSLQLATAALMVQVSVADGDFSARERTALQAALMRHFNLSEAEVSSLLERAERDQADATCLFAFTRTIAKELDNEGRQGIVRLLWHVALVDDTLDNFEANVIAKIAGLLGVSTADRVRLKQEVENSGHI